MRHSFTLYEARASELHTVYEARASHCLIPVSGVINSGVSQQFREKDHLLFESWESWDFKKTEKDLEKDWTSQNSWTKLLQKD